MAKSDEYSISTWAKSSANHHIAIDESIALLTALTMLYSKSRAAYPPGASNIDMRGSTTKISCG